MRPTGEQRAIMNHPLEPLRVQAGAGTGKTTTLAWRVADLVRSRGVAPQALLGITFTNKAAEELADRIRTELELSVSQAVEVHTYHGFAAQLVQEFGPLIGIERGFRIVTPTFGRQLLLDQITAGEFAELDLTFPRGIVARLIKLSSELSDHLLASADLIASSAGQEEEPWPARRELAEVLRSYEVSKRQLGVLDYGDLIRFAHQLVTTQPDVAERVRSRYSAVLLDEYQDSNPAQRELFRAVFGEGFPVTAVGDPHQTIYEWRGATRENFRQFPEHFPQGDGTPAQTKPLSLNRRSGREILRVANSVADKVGSSYRLRARPGAGPGHVGVSWHCTALDEAHWTADEITRLHQDGLQWRDMAILFRKNKDMALVRDALSDHDIPVEVANLGGLLSIPEVVELHAWLRVLRDRRDGVALVRILTGTRFRLGLADLRPLSEWATNRDGGGIDPERDSPEHSLVEAIERLAELEIREEARPVLDEFLAMYRRLLSDAQGVSLVELCRRILDAVDAWDEIEAMSDAGRLSARLNLYRFLDLAEDWSPLEGRPSLPAFLDHLELMQEEEAEDLDAARLSNEDAVVLLTIHRAKGLEWEAVFLPALYRRNFPSTARIHEDPFRFPQVLPYELRLDRESLPSLTADMSEKLRKEILSQRHLDQEWRTAYVAVTRARSRLYGSGAWWVGSPAPLRNPTEPSEFFELVSRYADDLGVTDQPGTRPDRLRPEPVSGAPDPVFPDGWQGALRLALEDPSWPATRAAELGALDLFEQERARLRELVASAASPTVVRTSSEMVETSATGLVTYAMCPRRFYWSEVDRLPRRSTRAARRGVLVHRRIELHNLGMVPFEEMEAELYDSSPEGDSAPSTKEPFTSFKKSRFAAVRPRRVEVPFELRLANAARVRGRIDAVYGGETTEVVDFKTGRPPSHPAARVQLESYGLAVTDAGLTSPPLRVTFAFLGDGLTEETEDVDDEWLDGARDHLIRLTDGIRAEQFDATPSGSCRSCDFRRFCEQGTRWVEEHPT